MIWALAMLIAGIVCILGGSYRLYQAVRLGRVWRSYEYFDRQAQPVDYWLVTLSRPLAILLGVILVVGGAALLLGSSS